MPPCFFSRWPFRHRSRLRVFVLGVCVLSLSATSNAQTTDTRQHDSDFFETRIRPILVEHCYDCHSTEEKTRGGLRLDSASAMLLGGDSGPAMVAGDADNSLILQALRYEDRDLQMPPRNRLPENVIKDFSRWINEGAFDPRDTSAADVRKPKTHTTTDADKTGRVEDHWSLQPVRIPLVPTVDDHDRVQTPIDAFVISTLEKQGLTLAMPAGRETLLRRVTQNLTGLPPTQSEINDFLSDQSHQAWSRVIDRLLGSPAYGERWGRHWLDVARYADSNGLDENLGYGQAWRYRDYVIESFNRDKPFDRFLVEQIAGDLIPNANTETRTATGFLALGAKVLAEPDLKKLEMDIIDEQVDTLGKAFLGMTFGCARCHDHKFDPILQSDYYSLAAIFKSTRTLADTKTGAIHHWYEHSFSDEAERQRLKAIDKEIASRKADASRFKNEKLGLIRADAKRHAADYLEAACLFDADASLNEVEAIARPRGLHPRILHHCRMHLDFHRGDPLFDHWHRFTGMRTASAIGNHYRDLFDQASEAWQKAKQADPATRQLKDPRLETARIALEDAAGFLAVPAKEEHAFDEETLSEYHRLMNRAWLHESQAADETAAMGVTDGTPVSTLAIHIRGSHKNLGSLVRREFPKVMRLSDARPIFPDGSSGRLELARWMADTRHPLTARVIVNRVWGWHFGRGLVDSTENFGVLGGNPSHPRLLDWLAVRFMSSGWSIKQLNRLILQSSVYQAASQHREMRKYETIDPENRLLWRANLQRLEAEQIRDTILSVSGRLDHGFGGKTLPLRNRQFVFNHTSEDHTRYDELRRAVYLPVIRNHLYTFFEQFDFPDPTMPTGSRNATVIAPQNLVLMNDPLVLESADAFARELLAPGGGDVKRVTHAYWLAFSREPSEVEVSRALAFIQRISHDGPSGDRRQLAWSMFCQSLMASNEFIYLR